MQSNRVIVIGGNGFIGANICKYFSEKNWSVTSFDLALPKEKIKNVEYIQGDYFNNTLLESQISDKDLIIHSLSTVNPGNSSVKFLQGYSLDFVQMARLALMLVGTDKKMIFISSGGTVYGNQTEFPIKETASLNPINHYGCLKVCIENMLRTYNIQNNTSILIARVSNPFGPGQDYKKGVGFVDAVLKKAINQEQIEIWGDGENIRDYIYIDDVCKMIFGMANYEGEIDTFNVSSGIGVSQNDIISLLKKQGYNLDVKYTKARSVDARKIVLDNSRIKEICDVGSLSFEDSLNTYLAVLKNQND